MFLKSDAVSRLFPATIKVPAFSVRIVVCWSDPAWSHTLPTALVSCWFKLPIELSFEATYWVFSPFPFESRPLFHLKHEAQPSCPHLHLSSGHYIWPLVCWGDTNISFARDALYTECPFSQTGCRPSSESKSPPTVVSSSTTAPHLSTPAISRKFRWSLLCLHRADVSPFRHPNPMHPPEP
jgi:hypothetical protein